MLGGDGSGRGAGFSSEGGVAADQSGRGARDGDAAPSAPGALTVPTQPGRDPPAGLSAASSPPSCTWAASSSLAVPMVEASARFLSRDWSPSASSGARPCRCPGSRQQRGLEGSSARRPARAALRRPGAAISHSSRPISVVDFSQVLSHPAATRRGAAASVAQRLPIAVAGASSRRGRVRQGGVRERRPRRPRGDGQAASGITSSSGAGSSGGPGSAAERRAFLSDSSLM